MAEERKPFEPLPALLRRVARAYATQKQKEYIAKLEAIAVAAALVVHDPSKMDELKEAIANLDPTSETVSGAIQETTR